MGRRAGIALFLALLLFTTSCNWARRSDRPAPVDTGPRVYGDPNSTVSPPASPTAAEAAPPPAGGNNGGRPRRGTSGSGGSGTNTDGGTGGTAQEANLDAADSGAAARPMLRPQPWTEIALEVDYVQGSAPRQDVLNYTVGQLRQITGKNVILQGGNAIPATDGEVTDDEVVRMSDRIRNLRSNQPRVAIHIMYLNGHNARSVPNPEGGRPFRIAGTAYTATMIAIWPEATRASATGAATAFALEGTVLMHEIGHLLAQTEIGYTSPRPRKDPGYGNHTRNSESVMYWKAETDALDTILRGNQPMQFDADDLADFRDLAAGRL